jgi:IS30 family transposase
MRQPGKRRQAVPPRPRQHQKHLTAAERAEVARRYIAGETMADLAASFGCDRDAIRRALKREGVEPRNWRTKVADPARIVELYEAGQTAA